MIVDECKLVHRNQVMPGMLAEDLRSYAYPEGDFHSLFYGEITAVYADEDARQRL